MSITKFYVANVYIQSLTLVEYTGFIAEVVQNRHSLTLQSFTFMKK